MSHPGDDGIRAAEGRGATLLGALAGWWGLLAVELVTLAVFSLALWGEVQWDDPDQFAELAVVRDPRGLRQIWGQLQPTAQYYPLSLTVFWALWQSFGLCPPVFHGANLLLHLGSVALVFALARRIDPRWALWGAALFALHPAAVAAVAWMCQLRNDLAVHLALWAAWNWTRGEETQRPRYWLAAWLFFTGGLLCKTAIAPLPVVLGLVFRQVRPDRQRWLRLAPLVGVALGLSLVTIMHEMGGGASGQTYQASLALRLSRAGWIAWFYLGQLVVPAWTSFVHVRWAIDFAAPWAMIPTALGLGLLVALAWIDRRRDTAWCTWLLAYLAMLFPVLGLFNVFYMRYAWVADHWHYPALAVAAGGLVYGLSRLDRAANLPRWAPLLVVLPLAVWTAYSARAASLFRTQEAIWRDTLAKNPDSWLARNNYGVLLLRAGRLDEAQAQLERAGQIDAQSAATALNLGWVAEGQGRLAEAESEFRRARTLDPQRPHPRAPLVRLLLKLGRLDEAEREGRALVGDFSGFAPGWSALGQVLWARGHEAEALGCWRRALELDPADAKARAALAGSGDGSTGP